MKRHSQVALSTALLFAMLVPVQADNLQLALDLRLTNRNTA